jgi:hypothetical protein
MKSNNLKKALERFNDKQENNKRVEVLNPLAQGAVRGGTLGCPCKKNQSVVCSVQYSHGG